LQKIEQGPETRSCGRRRGDDDDHRDHPAAQAGKAALTQSRSGYPNSSEPLRNPAPMKLLRYRTRRQEVPGLSDKNTGIRVQAVRFCLDRMTILDGELG
jgi:hypothetical protein